MHLNRSICAFLAIFCVFFAGCERDDILDRVGGDIVKDMDHTLDMELGFDMLSINTWEDAAEYAFSLPAAANPAFSTQITGNLLIGVNSEEDGGDRDTLAAHMQFKATPFVAMDRTAPYTAEDYYPDTAWLHFRSADSKTSDEAIAVFPSDTLTDMSPVKRSDKDVYMLKCAEPDACLDDEGNPVTGESGIGTFTVSGAGGVDLIPLPKEYVDKIFAARVSDDSTAGYGFAFSIVDYEGETRTLQLPSVIFRVKKKGEPTTRMDTLLGYTRFTAFEADAAARAGEPYSSQRTQRTAVFRIDLGKMLSDIDSLESGRARRELINAVLSVTASREKAGDNGNGDGNGNGNGGEEGSPAALRTYNGASGGSYRLFISDTLLTTNDLAANDSEAARRRSMRYQFSTASASQSRPAIPFNTHAVEQVLKDAIKKHVENERPAGPHHIYVYLRPVADNTTILWEKSPEKSPKVEAVFTPTRSQ